MSEEIYNLIMSGDYEAWEDDSYIFDSRRFPEHTLPELKAKFSKITSETFNELKKYPCIFAYERGGEKDGSIGYITDVIVRSQGIKITFRKEATISLEDLRKLSFELDINEGEFTRTHWAVKKVDLHKELRALSIKFNFTNRPVDVNKHIFDVAFTFAGESRGIVEPVVRELEGIINKNNIFYDNSFVSQISRPSLNKLLQDIYRNRSKLIAVFLCEKYNEEEWCGIEFKAIEELIMEKDVTKIMYIRLDDGKVDGVFKTDGYIDGRIYTTKQLAHFINKRLSILSYSE